MAGWTTPGEDNAEGEQDEREGPPAEALPGTGGRELHQRPYAQERDTAVAALCKRHGADFRAFKDQVGSTPRAFRRAAVRSRFEGA